MVNIVIQTKEASTPIPDAFIDKFMLELDNPVFGLVYILGQRYSSSGVEISNGEIAKKLDILESDVVRAWKYWKEKGIVDFSEDMNDIEFLQINKKKSRKRIELLEETDFEDGGKGEKSGKSEETAEGAKLHESPEDSKSANSEELRGRSAMPNNSFFSDPGNSRMNPIWIKTADYDPEEKARNSENIAKVQFPEVKKVIIDTYPTYTRQEIDAFLSGCGEIRALFDLAQKMLAKPLTNDEMNKILSFYDWLNLPLEVIEVLLEHCITNEHRSMRYLEKVALDWSENKINTKETAEAHVAKFSKVYGEVLKSFGIFGRAATPIEIRYIDKWLEEFKMPLELIKMAMEKTVSQTGKTALPYANGILEKWNAENVRTIQAAEALDIGFYENIKAAKLQGAGEKAAKAGKQPIKSTRFSNLDERQNDYDEIKRKEREYAKKFLED